MRNVLNQRRALAGIAMLMLVCGLAPARWLAPLTGRVRHVVLLTINPLTGLLKTIGDGLRRPSDHPLGVAGDELARHYADLLQSYEQLQQDLNDAQEQVRMLSQVRSILGMQTVDAVPARVTSAGGDPRAPTIVIDRGQRHGLGVGLAVTRGSNLVGRVVEVGPVSATVALITRPGATLTVHIKPPVVGPQSPSLPAQLRATREGSDFQARVRADDPVAIDCLAHLADESWPPQARGFVVGSVRQISEDPQNPLLYRNVVVSPNVSLRHLTEVAVLVPTEVAR